MKIISKPVVAKHQWVAWILMAGYLYYIHNYSLLQDREFDQLCKLLLANYDSVEHQHKFILTEDMLRAGSLYNLKATNYPNRVRMGALCLWSLARANELSAVRCVEEGIRNEWTDISAALEIINAEDAAEEPPKPKVKKLILKRKS